MAIMPNNLRPTTRPIEEVVAVVKRINERRMVEGGDAGTDTVKLLRPLPLTTTRIGAVREEERLFCFMKREKSCLFHREKVSPT